jgi:hypothetical protein
MRVCVCVFSIFLVRDHLVSDPVCVCVCDPPSVVHRAEVARLTAHAAQLETWSVTAQEWMTNAKLEQQEHAEELEQVGVHSEEGGMWAIENQSPHFL